MISSRYVDTLPDLNRTLQEHHIASLHNFLDLKKSLSQEANEDVDQGLFLPKCLLEELMTEQTFITTQKMYIITR